MEKKGMSQDVLVLLLIVLVIAGVFAYLVIGFVGKIYTETPVEACRFSVQEMTQLDMLGRLGESIGKVEFTCPEVKLLFKEEEYRRNNVNKKYGKEGYEEDVRYLVAEEMSDCWYKFGQGTLDAYDTDFLFGADEECFHCSYITFEEPEAESVTRFSTYLKENTPARGALTQDERTYWEYMRMNYNSGNNIVVPAAIDTSKAYGITFAVRDLDESDHRYFISLHPSGEKPTWCSHYYN